MRIQHNIMAMNAYRNYNSNVSAMKSNLEKLSSGYKINRAGDDAAGLAISEKMRAQITGLNAAQKNVKDGISLVQTAEGAMQEVQDMLNRMVYLATQSANGTYDNEVDRNNLQKELDQLRSEIDRISDSANFNGIKLLDGSKDATATGVGATEASAGTVASIVTSTVGGTLGTDTILHSSGVTAVETEFGVDLHELTFSNNTGETLTLKIGNNTFKLAGGAAGTAGTELDAKGIVDAFAANKFTDAAGNTVTAATVSLTDGTNTGTFAAKADGTRITFKQAVGGDPVNGDMEVNVSSSASPAVKAGWKTGAYTVGTTDAAGTTGMNDDAKVAVTVKIPDSTGAGGPEEALTFTTANLANAATAADIVTALKATTATNANHDTVTLGDLYDITSDATTGAITFALKDNKKGTITGVTYTPDSGTAAGTDVKASLAAGAATTATPAGDEPVSGDYNTNTTVTKQGVAEGSSRIASGVATVDKDFFAKGNIIKVGDKEYTVSTDAADKDADSKVYVGDLDLSTPDGLNTAIDRLSVRADNNAVWTIGHGATPGQITFVEKVGADGKSYTDNKTGADGKLADGAFDLSKESVIKETFGTITGKKEASAGVDGKALTFQIGDTAEEYNQLKVSIGDIHTEALGIDAISIAKQEDAAKAVEKIKNAINTVSGIRGDLGATQNRLEHTANNLSVMTENITDAESSIRDTDVAEEMMSYTKNNILIQAAQAMLAQANQIPQGVLQLLQ